MSYEQLAVAVDTLTASTTALTEQALTTQQASESAKDTAIAQAAIATDAASYNQAT